MIYRRGTLNFYGPASFSDTLAVIGIIIIVILLGAWLVF